MEIDNIEEDKFEEWVKDNYPEVYEDFLDQLELEYYIEDSK